MPESMSPLPVKVLLDFPSAIKKVTEGKKISRVEWKNRGFYVILRESVLKLHKPDGNFYDWIINDGDLNGTDWIIL